MKNINSFDDEARTSQEKHHVPLSPQETHLGAFRTKE
jgi:hypothetical protein